VTAENEGQGVDTISVPLPAGVHDMLQLNDVLTRLPLAVGFERTLAFFDLVVYSGTSMGLGDDGIGYSRRYVGAAPVYVTATVRVTGRQSVWMGGEEVSAYRVEVFFRGSPAHPVMTDVGPEPGTKGRAGDPLIYHLSADAPHRVLMVDWRALAVQRARD
jgi:hypothetical protein